MNPDDEAEDYLDPTRLPRIATEAGPHTAAAVRRAVVALERIADSCERLHLQLALEQRDLR